jgi:hypothetical protein
VSSELQLARSASARSAARTAEERSRRGIRPF